MENYIPIQTTRAYREAQEDPLFNSWLKMQEASMQIEFPIYDITDIGLDELFRPDTLGRIEAALLNRFEGPNEPLRSEESNNLRMKFVYYVGEVFRVNLEGSWRARPRENRKGNEAVIELPFSEVFVMPEQVVGQALYRRTGDRISTIYGHKKRRYNTWVQEGRPALVFQGTLRED